LREMKSDDPKLTLPDNGHGLNGVKADKSANGVGSSHDDSKEMSLVSRWARKTFTKKQLYRKLPILEWAPKYTLSHFISDAIAGTTVALTVIPQGIAYAIVAGLDPQYGLYSAFMGGFVYCIFGSSKDITVGPTAIMSLMTAEYAKGHGAEHTPPELAILLAFTTGIVVFLFGLLKFGFLIEFFSVPVIAGFTSAAAISIASGQVDKLLGLTITNKTEIPGVIGDYVNIFENIDTFRWQDCILGTICMVLLLLMREMKNITWFKEVDPEAAESATSCQSYWARRSPVVRQIAEKTIWFTCIARNAIIVMITLLIAYLLDGPDLDPNVETTFKLTGNITAGFPEVGLPSFSYVDESGHEVNFAEMLGKLNSALIIIPIIAILENVAIAKAFAGGKHVDASQEMIALGLCNFAASFFQAYPTTGSFSRTAVNNASGVKTTAGGVFTGLIVILALVVLMPACAFIPKATLAAVIITAVIFSVEFEYIMPMLRSKKSDLFCSFVTFCCCLFWALEWGILVGVGVHVIFIMWDTAHPNLRVQREHLSGPGTAYLVIRVDRSWIFPSVQYVRNIVNKVGVRQGEARVPVVLDCSHIYTSDFSSALGAKAMAADFERRDQPLIFLDIQESVKKTFDGAGHGQVVTADGSEELRTKMEELFSRQETDADGAGDGELPNSSSAHPVSPGSSHSVPDVQQKTKDPLLDNQEAMGQIDSGSSSSADEGDVDKKD